MSRSLSLLRFASLVLCLCAVGISIWVHITQIQRVETVTRLPTPSGVATEVSGRSPTGYADGQRGLILAARNVDSFHWVMQTQQMFGLHEWRVRHVDYDNAPEGREVSTPSPYRWWLGLIAWIDHVISHRSLGLATEQAMVWGGPTLQMLALVGAAVFVAWRFGFFAATLVSLGVAGWFPFNEYFHAALPDDHGFANLCAFGGIVLFLTGIAARSRERGGDAHRWFALAGVMSAIAAWVSLSIEIPILVGTGLGALAGAWLTRERNGVASPIKIAALPWRTWALSCGATAIAAYGIEYYPHLDLIKNLSVLDPGLNATRLSALTENGDAPNFASWIFRVGFSSTVVATALPLLVIVLCLVLTFRLAATNPKRGMLAIALGPAAVAAVFAFFRLEWWGTLDAVTLALVVAASANPDAHRQPSPEIPGTKIASPQERFLPDYILSSTILLIVLGTSAVYGVLRILPRWSGSARVLSLSGPEAELWVERDVAGWLRQRADGEIRVFAPPATTLSLCYFGGFSGIGTLSPDNQSGITGSVRISTATSDEEAHALIEARGVTHIVLPSWDSFFLEYIQSRFSRPEAAFINRLENGNVPLWLRPIAYPNPNLPGFENQMVRVYVVVAEQKETVASSRLAEYWLEIGDLEKAGAAEVKLRRFPSDVGALVARARVCLERGESDELSKTFDRLLARLALGGDRMLPWDRRVSLAILLARGKRIELAREQLRRCFAEVDRLKLQSLPTAELYNFLGLGRALGLSLADPSLQTTALALLPPQSRSRLQQSP